MFEPPPHLRLELPADRTAPKLARDALLRLLDGEARPSFTYEAELLTSEIVSNAIQAGSACEVSVWFVASEHALRVEVVDTAAGVPTLPERDPSAPPGRRRGLSIVDQLSTRWGVTLDRGRKEVWFEIC